MICHEVGFFQLVDHGVDTTFVDDYFDAIERFFALPDTHEVHDREDQFAVVPWMGACRRGTHRQPCRLPRTDRRVGPICHPDRATCQPPYLRLDGPNQWLDESVLPGFRSLVERFQHEMGRIADQLMSAMCIGLGLAPRPSRQGVRRPPVVADQAHPLSADAAWRSGRECAPRCGIPHPAVAARRAGAAGAQSRRRVDRRTPPSATRSP